MHREGIELKVLESLKVSGRTRSQLAQTGRGDFYFKWEDSGTKLRRTWKIKET